MTDPQPLELHQRLARELGALQATVMQTVWSAGKELSARDVVEVLGAQHHYNTILTVMERLERQRLLVRRRSGRAHLYSARLSQHDYVRAVTGSKLRDLLAEFGEGAIAAFVDAIEEVSPQALERLERLVADRRTSKEVMNRISHEGEAGG